MKTSESRGGGTVLLMAFVLLLLPAAYVGSYAALVDRAYTGPGWNDMQWRPVYRYIDGTAARVAFRPVHEVDRRVRPDYWNVEMFIY